MGRPSKLDDRQWEQITTRNLKGESICQLAKEFKVSKALISERLSKNKTPLKTIANQIVEVEELYHNLNLSEQRIVNNLAESIKAISHNLAGTARNGSITAFRLSSIACNQSAKINFDDPMESQEILQSISGLTKIANEASVVGMQLLNANKEANKQKDDSIIVKRDYGAITQNGN